MGKVIVGLGAMLVALVLALSVPAFETKDIFSGVIQGEPSVMSCSSLPVIRAVMKTDGVDYTVFVEKKSKRTIIVKHDAEGNPVEIAFGVMIQVNGSVQFVTRQMLSADEGVKLYPDPCDYLAMKEA